MLKLKKMAEHNKIGKIGEEVAVKYLLSKNFLILEKNYNCKVGELDIICKKEDSLIFVEVKSKKIRNFKEIENLDFKPEDNMSYMKKIKMKKAIRHYLLINKIQEFSICIEVIVFLEENSKKAKIRLYRDVIL